MDNPSPNPAGDSWMGWPVENWEGDTLVVDVTGMNDQTWFDRAGGFQSNDLHVIERWTSQVCSHPWKIRIHGPYQRHPTR